VLTSLQTPLCISSLLWSLYVPLLLVCILLCVLASFCGALFVSLYVPALLTIRIVLCSPRYVLPPLYLALSVCLSFMLVSMCVPLYVSDDSYTSVKFWKFSVIGDVVSYLSCRSDS
jgi:hypothetical protein